ncbi:hypothetical protein SOPP22_14760 [Shewanella sp. OPT22]|nr:hypothetical protein SOPP22_14760 [Shewanella sp. OPT22]
MAINGPSATIYLNPENPKEIQQISIGDLGNKSSSSEQLINVDVVSGKKTFKVRLWLKPPADGTFFSDVNVEPASGHYSDMVALTSVQDYQHHLKQAFSYPSSLYFNTGEQFRELNQEMTTPTDMSGASNQAISHSPAVSQGSYTPSNPLGQPTLDVDDMSRTDDSATNIPFSELYDFTPEITDKTPKAADYSASLDNKKINKEPPFVGELSDWEPIAHGPKVKDIDQRILSPTVGTEVDTVYAGLASDVDTIGAIIKQSVSVEGEESPDELISKDNKNQDLRTDQKIDDTPRLYSTKPHFELEKMRPQISDFHAGQSYSQKSKNGKTTVAHITFEEKEHKVNDRKIIAKLITSSSPREITIHSRDEKETSTRISYTIEIDLSADGQ